MKHRYLKIKWLVILGFLCLIVSFFHLWQLDTIPRGLYLDESSIGYNAGLIAKTGYDEHDKLTPVFFEAFGEYKNPLYIYTTALLFKISHVSIFTLRFTSFLFFLLFLLGIYFLTSSLFKNKVVIAFALLAAGFLPWFFSLSRIAFEIISQISVVIFALIFIRRTFQSKDNNFLNPWETGFFLGLSLYTYSTARLLTPLLLISVFIIYHRFVKKLLVITSSFLLTILPYISFSISNPGTLTNRFNVVTYIHRPDLTIIEKVQTFFGNYFNYISPGYLLFKGDTSPRHHTGANGEIYLIVFILFLVFVFYKVKQRSFPDKFQLLLLANLVFAPVAAALTTGDSSLRSILIGLYLLIFSFYGLHFILKKTTGSRKSLVVVLVFGLLIVESVHYVGNYFYTYPSVSSWAFESYDFNNALDLAYSRQPKKIIISNTLDQTGIHYKFYTQIHPKRPTIPVFVESPFYATDTCSLFQYPNKEFMDASPYHAKFTAESGVYTMVRCY